MTDHTDETTCVTVKYFQIQVISIASINTQGGSPGHFTLTNTHTNLQGGGYMGGGGGVYMTVKKMDSSEIVIEQLNPEDSFVKEEEVKVMECLRQNVPNRWASVTK